ncbi:AAA family ATPase [Sulfurimonas sp.]|uniref:AAA family ATPase n=1 Tax=Sulfurimonas sp. TaxID=2022749 RepID=UPI0035624E2E
MKFNSVIIENLFSYKGQIKFDFNDSDKPISLIIGENGFGKTSFINSIKIALHGITKDLLSIGELVLTKQDYILGNKDKNFSGILNRIAKQNNENKAAIIIEVNDGDTFYVQREYTLKNTTYSESLNILDNEKNVLYTDIEAQDFINYKVSPTLAKFFFFDGEKVQTIADFSKDEFRQMLEDVLELDIYDQLIYDSRNVIKKINKNELDSELQKLVTKKEAELVEVQNDLLSANLKLEAKSLDLKELLHDQSELDKKLSKLRSKYKKPLEEEKSKLAQYIEQKSLSLSRFRELSYIQLPLLLNKKLTDSIDNDIEKNYKGNITISQDIVAIKKKEFLKQIDTEQRTNIEKIFDKVFNSDENSQSVPFADSIKLESQFNSLKEKELDFKELLNDLILLKEQIKYSEDEIYSLELKIQEDKVEYEKDFKQVKVIAENIGIKKSEVENLENQINSLLSMENEINKEISRTSVKEHKNSLSKLKIQSLESAIKVASQMKIKIKEDKKEILETSINIKFNLLKKQGYEADCIKLDSDFNINIFDKDMNPMDILSSSSGQKQIIATALIWGISEYISEEIPMIIDTPLGRLDEKNQSLILNQFYPNASSQVLILPTPSELKNEGFKGLRDNVSQVFTLSNKGSATTIQEQNKSDFFDNRYN